MSLHVERKLHDELPLEDGIPGIARISHIRYRQIQQTLRAWSQSIGSCMCPGNSGHIGSGSGIEGGVVLTPPPPPPWYPGSLSPMQACVLL